MNVNEQIKTNGPPELGASPALEPYRDASQDSAEQIIAGIVKADHEDRGGRSVADLVAAGSDGDAEPAEPGKRQLLGALGSLSDALTTTQAKTDQAERDAQTEATAAAFRDAAEMGDGDAIVSLGRQLGQLNPDALAAEIREIHQFELDERSEFLGFTGSDDEFASNYDDLMDEPTAATEIAAALNDVISADTRERLEREHEAASAALTQKEFKVRVATLGEELGVGDDLDKIEQGYNVLTRVQEQLRDPEFAIEVLGESGWKLAQALTVPLSEVPPDDPRFPEMIRGLAAVERGLSGKLTQSRLLNAFFGEGNTSMSEAMSGVPRPSVRFSINPKDVVDAMQKAPRKQRNGQELRESIASQPAGLERGFTIKGRPAKFGESAGFKAQAAAEKEAERRARGL